MAIGLESWALKAWLLSRSRAFVQSHTSDLVSSFDADAMISIWKEIENLTGEIRSELDDTPLTPNAAAFNLARRVDTAMESLLFLWCCEIEKDSPLSKG
jgi:hypothetical protein